MIIKINISNNKDLRLILLIITRVIILRRRIYSLLKR
jgi:hypothetical protein